MPRVDVLWPIVGRAGYSPDTNWSLDIFERLEAKVFKLEIYLIGDFVVDSLRYIDAARIREGFKPRRYIHGIAENVTAFGDDGAKIDADTNGDPPLRRERLIPLRKCAAYGRSTPRRLRHISKFAERQIAGFLKNAPAM